MGTIRHETYYASGYLIEQLWNAGVLRNMKHDGMDIVLFETITGQQVSMHFIDGGIPLYEIRKILTENQTKGIYTLFLLWCDMMLPYNGQQANFNLRMGDWMEALYTLYGDAIYAYEFLDSEIYIFPVYFRGTGQFRSVEYGTTIRARNLTCRVVETRLPGLEGAWRVADFGGATATAHDPQAEATLLAAYQLLGVMLGDDRETIKRAYRLAARRLHPDANTSPDATEQMQRLNAAYAQILKQLGE